MDDSCRTSQKSGQTREDVEKGLRDPKIDGNNTVYLPAGRPTSPVNRISTETTKDIQGATSESESVFLFKDHMLAFRPLLHLVHLLHLLSRISLRCNEASVVVRMSCLLHGVISHRSTGGDAKLI